MTELVEVMIDSIRVSLTNQQRIVLLRELDSEHFLPIWIGPYEAESITIALQEIEIARPQTHDLLIRALDQLKVRLIRVEIVALRGDVFYGNLVIEANKETIYVDSRPSDSIALAVRAHVPILVSKEILTTAGVTPERDIQNDTEDEAQSVLDMEEGKASKKRLSVFEDFLQNAHLDDEGTDDPSKPDLTKPESDLPEK
jgi:bifunctional DNase/RNase